MIAGGPFSACSVDKKNRPRSSGIFSVSKNPASIRLTRALGSSPGAEGLPAIENEILISPWVNGKGKAPVAPCTPGICFIFASTC